MNIPSTSVLGRDSHNMMGGHTHKFLYVSGPVERHAHTYGLPLLPCGACAVTRPLEEQHYQLTNQRDCLILGCELPKA